MMCDFVVFWNHNCATFIESENADCMATLSLLSELFFQAYFSTSPERKNVAKCCDAPTGPMTLLLYYSFDGCVEGVEILHRT